MPLPKAGGLQRSAWDPFGAACVELVGASLHFFVARRGSFGGGMPVAEASTKSFIGHFRELVFTPVGLESSFFVWKAWLANLRMALRCRSTCCAKANGSSDWK